MNEFLSKSTSKRPVSGSASTNLRQPPRTLKQHVRHVLSPLSHLPISLLAESILSLLFYPLYTLSDPDTQLKNVNSSVRVRSISSSLCYFQTDRSLKSSVGFLVLELTPPRTHIPHAPSTCLIHRPYYTRLRSAPHNMCAALTACKSLMHPPASSTVARPPLACCPSALISIVSSLLHVRLQAYDKCKHPSRPMNTKDRETYLLTLFSLALLSESSFPFHQMHVPARPLHAVSTNPAPPWAHTWAPSDFQLQDVLIPKSPGPMLNGPCTRQTFVQA